MATENNIKMSEIMNAVCIDVEDMYIVNMKTEAVTFYRRDKANCSPDACGGISYSMFMEEYIQQKVHPGDRNDMRRNSGLEQICAKLEDRQYFNIYYRAMDEGESRYFQMQCIRMDEGESTENVLILFMPDETEHERRNDAFAISTDDTTSALTKAAFFRRAREIIEDNPDKHFDIIITDIENFRLVNSVYGESKGNEVLRYLADSYSNMRCTRLCGRYSGDQFIILSEMEEEPFYEGSLSILNAIKVNAPVPYLTLKYGVLRDVERGESLTSMCDKAILALKENRHNFEKNVTTYNEQVIRKHFQNQIYEAGFERAIYNGEFVVWIQPKFNSKTKKITGGEALTRWKNSDGSYTSPGDFIPLFESNGLIVKLDEHIFRKVCAKQRELLDSGIRPVPVSVNMSRTTLFHPGTVGKYKEIIGEYDLPIELVPIEITESAAIDSAKIANLIGEIKDAGFKLHLDDFGTGYSSLSSLSMLPFDAVKLDKGLIDDIGNEGGDEILRHIIEMAHFFKMEVVAEGVESRIQHNFMRKLNCDTIQGFYFSRPVQFDEFTDMVRKNLRTADDFAPEEQDEEAIGSLRITNEVKLQYLTAIGSIYMTMHVVDLVNDTVTEFATTTNVKEHVNKVHGVVNQMERAMRGTASPEYLNAVLEFTDLTTIQERMRGRRTIAEEFVGRHFGWFRARFITVTSNEKEEPTVIIFTTQVIEADKRKEEMLLRACRTDELTGVLNRRAYDEDIKTLSDSEETKPETDTDLVAMMIDVNGLKLTNDRLGHAAGDELLRGASQCIKNVIGKRGTIYRLGGDEFAAVFYANQDEISRLEETYKKAVDAWMGNTVRTLSTSWGIVSRKDCPGATIQELIDLADRKMYENKARYYEENR